MARAQFSEETGRLRLDREAFEQLVGTMAAAAPDAQLAASAKNPKVKAGIDAVLDPVCQLRVTIANATAHMEHEGWLTTQVAALLLQSDDGLYDFLTVAPEFVPTVLARMAKIGPRRVGERSAVPVDEETLDALFDPDAEERVRAFGVVSDTSASLAFRVEVAWQVGGDDSGGRGVVVLDGVGGLYVFMLDDGRAEFVPVDGTFVWAAFCGLLPEDSDLAGWMSTGGAIDPGLATSR